MTDVPPTGGFVRLSRRELFRAVSARTGVSQKQLQGVLSVMQEIAVEHLETVGSFEIPGLCRFILKRKRPRRYAIDGRVRDLPFRQVLKAEPVKRLRDLFYSLDDTTDPA